MKSRKIFAVLAVATAVLALSVIAAICLTARNSTPRGIGVADAGDTVAQFCDALEEGDREEIGDMIYGYSDLNLNGRPESDSAAELYDCLWDSYTCSPDGELHTLGTSAQQDVTVGYFDVYLAEEKVRGLVQEHYLQYIENAQELTGIFDENNELTEAAALEIYGRAVKDIIAGAGGYMTEQTVTLEMVYADGRWQVILTDSLAWILLGGVNRG